MTNKIIKNFCTGCSACESVCVQGAISMIEDIEGFLYHKIDSKKCIKCYECKEVCPVINNVMNNNEKTPIVYAAKSLDEKVVANSSSGGIFFELAKDVLSQDGYVVAAKYNSCLLVEHDIIHDIEKLNVLQKSKYTQSKLGKVYRKIKDLLDKGEKVLFVGTPCQTAGIKRFLKIEYNNLLICDLVCHGVNSPQVYRKYLNCMEKKYGSKVKSIDFRDKRNGWAEFGTRIIFENNEQYFKTHKQEIFYEGFIRNLFLRPSCYQCKYKGYNRISDITIADFWGINLLDKSKSLNSGISLVLIHNKKGNKNFEKIKNNIFIEQHTIEEAIAKNPCLIKPVGISELRKEFFKMYIEETKDVDEIIAELLNRSMQ